MKRVDEIMTMKVEEPDGFNDCRCVKCDTRIGWFGKLSDPVPCDKCGHINTYNCGNLNEARKRVIQIIALEELVEELNDEKDKAVVLGIIKELEESKHV